MDEGREGQGDGREMDGGRFSRGRQKDGETGERQEKTVTERRG